MMYFVVTRTQHHHAKYTRHQQHLRYSKIEIQRKKDSPRKRSEIIYKCHMLSLTGNRTLCKKFLIINSQHPHWITVNTGGNHHGRNHKVCTNLLTSLTQIGFFCTHAQPSVPSETKILSKTSNPVMQ